MGLNKALRASLFPILAVHRHYDAVVEILQYEEARSTDWNCFGSLSRWLPQNPEQYTADFRTSFPVLANVREFRPG